MTTHSRKKEQQGGDQEPGEKKRILLIPKDTYRFNNLNFLRSLLALLVLWGHCFLIFYGTEEEVEPLYVWSDGQISLALFAVNFFFVISGFLILLSWEKRDNLWYFLKKRILRIYPAFIVVSLVCLFLFAPFGTSDFFQPIGYWKLYFQSIDWKLIPQNILLLNEPKAPWVFKNAPVSNTLNLPIWTIKFEFICYLMVPVLALVGLFRNKITSLVLFVSVYSLYVYQNYTGQSFFGWKEYPVIGPADMIVQFFTFFCAGMVVYKYRQYIPRARWMLYVSIAITIISMLFLKGLVITLPVFGCYVLFYAAFARSYSLIGFSKWGDFSYGTYLYAWPIQQLMLLYFEKHMDVTLLFILSTSLTLCFAYLSWHYIEKPCLGLKDTSLWKKKSLQHV